MSRNYYSEQFKRVMGLNFIDFVIRLRIHYAMQLLRQTNLKVYDIGEQAGFHSSKHFLKLFKRVVNCTPAEFRQNQGS
jgi:two-component system response regulator YesN